MTALVPYGPDSDEEDEVIAVKEEEKPKKRKLTTFDRREGSSSNKRDNVHTSLGISASSPIKGDWLCYAFVPVHQIAEVYDVMKETYSLLSSYYHDRIEWIPDIHISLTKPILIRHHEKEDLTVACREAALQFGRAVKPCFPLAFAAFTLLPSRDKERMFWAAEVGLGWQELQSLTSSLNSKLATFHAREYFKEARFHASFASMSTGLLTKQQQLDMTKVLETKLGDKLRSCTSLYIDKIGVAIGSQRYYIDIQV